jgi:hypothetical protein
MRILIVENITPVSRGGNPQKWMGETTAAYGLAVEDEFDVIVGMDEDGDCPLIQDRAGMGLIEFETVMARGG